MGVTGQGGVLPHRPGEGGVEVELGPTGLPAGAILLGTNDAQSMNAFFARLLALAEGAAGSSFGGSGAGSSFGSPSAAPASHLTRSTYRGFVIPSCTSPHLRQF